MNRGQISTKTRRTENALELWGLTGGIAAGKSLAARFFAELGVPVLDADRISRELSAEGGAAHPMILKRFGTAERRRLRELIFTDPAARRDLEAILHPLIQAESMRQAGQVGDRGHVIYEAALLVETGRYKTLQGLITVEAPEDMRRNRLVTRDRITPEAADRILAVQASEAARRNVASVVFENAGTPEALRKQVEAFISTRGWGSPIPSNQQDC